MEEKLQFSHIFLQIFIAEAICSLKKIKNIPDAPIIPEQETIRQQIQLPLSPKKISPSKQQYELMPRNSKIKLKEIDSLPILHLNQNRPINNLPNKVQRSGSIELGKLSPIIADPSIQIIECAGPGKNIFVRKGNSILSSRISLTEEEIKKILEEFSKESKIPLLKGVFKAAVENLLITAVISDFVESRFIIQKRNPFIPLEMNQTQYSNSGQNFPPQNRAR